MFPLSTLSSSWYSFMPSGQDACVDVSAGKNAPPGSPIGTYVCFGSGTDFQLFTLDPLAGTLVAIRTAVSNFNVAADPDGAVIVQVNDPSNPAQRWEPQLESPGAFQFVNESNGLCLTAPASFGPLSVSACDGSPAQAFTAVPG
ncbi:RICIN domain-containing protein [Diaminobutyricibacter sp. McL0608]|uniref:RICIN domain-containing protein n=1 Tax=Leifsonia sp. McL0608 TaxID=3143537 RepID=UPI0031F31978